VATENGPDLTSARRAVERLMDDTCRVWPPDYHDSWAIDPDTLKLSPPAGAAPLYEGRFKFADAQNRGGNFGSEGGAPLAFAGKKASFPLQLIDDAGNLVLDGGGLPQDVPQFPEGSEIEVTSSRRDPSVAGTWFVVTEPVSKTMATSRQVLCTRRDRVE
jgi:hypothetical protein